MMLEQFVCPSDRGPLKFHPLEKGGKLTGFLLNPRTKIAYPVIRSIPRFVALDASAAESFEADYGVELARQLPGFKLHSEPVHS